MKRTIPTVKQGTGLGPAISLRRHGCFYRWRKLDNKLTIEFASASLFEELPLLSPDDLPPEDLPPEPPWLPELPACPPPPLEWLAEAWLWPPPLA
jgi:hypothetical protein